MEKENNNQGFISNTKKKINKGVSIVKFTFTTVLALITFTFTVLNLSIKVATKGWSISTYILGFAAILYLVLIAFLYILLRFRLNEKDDTKLKGHIDNFKYFIRVVKLALPIILLFNLIGNPVYDVVVVFFSILSITFGFISFAIATRMLVNKKRKIKK